MHDQLGRKLHLTAPPQRIISLVPSLSELLVDLGLKEHLAGITKFCEYPEELKAEKTIIGGTKSIHPERLQKLNPDFILCNKEENTPEIVATCAEVAPVYVSDIQNLEDLYVLLTHLGMIFNIPQKTDALKNQIQALHAEFIQKTSKFSKKRVAYVIWKEPLMVAGGQTFINSMLKLFSFENPFAAQEARYPEIEESDLEDVDLVLLSSEPFPFKQKHIAEFKKFTQAQVFTVDGSFFSWYGSRLLAAFPYFKELIGVLEMEGKS